jgi:hypothetical protein
VKVTFELDITPKEVLELFEGNVEGLQKAMMELFLKKMPPMMNATSAKTGENSMMEFWQAMAEKSTSMFEQYQKPTTSPSKTKK